MAGEDETLVRENPARSRYYPLIAGAVEDIEHNTADARRALYDRARSALSAWAGTGDSPPAEAEVERQRQALEEAVSYVEAEASQREHLKSASAKRMGEPPSDSPPIQPVLDHVDEGSPEVDREPAAVSGRGHLHCRLQAVIQAARYHGIELDANEFRNSSGEAAPSAAELSHWAENAGMWSRAVRMRWRHLLRFNDTGPVVLLFKDGSAGLLTGADAAQQVVHLKDPRAPAGGSSVAVDELRLSQVWAGEAVLLRANRGSVAADALFNLRWLVDLVLNERRSLRDIGLASLTISILTIFPPLLVMAMVNKVLQFHSASTLS